MATEADDLKIAQEQAEVRALKGDYKYGWHDATSYDEKPEKGVSHEVIDMMSDRKGEPDWMRKFRHKSLDVFYRKPMPTWGADLSGIDFDDIYYYIKPMNAVKSWEDMPEDIKATWDKLGIPEAEKNYLGGVTAQYECLRADTRVWTTTGAHYIKDIQVGETVFAVNRETESLETAVVIGMAESGDKEIFEIRASGRVIGASANHPFLVLREDASGTRPIEWTPVEELAPGDLVAVATSLPAEPTESLLSSDEVDVRHGESIGFVRIESIESVGVEPTYDIEVEGHHNFVAEGFIVHNSEVVYHKTKKELEDRGIIFTDMDTALREHEDIVKQYFGTIIPPADNKFSALNSAVWSGGSFIYVPPNTEVEIPLQAYFRINQENMGQFERTLIIVDESSWVHYVEGCSAPIYTSDSLHSAVVEIVVKKGGRARYTTIQNWSNNVYNLVTKRAAAYEDAIMEWVDGNLGCLAEGSRVTTRSGQKPIELLTPGEEVLSFDESAGSFVWRKVLGKRFSGHQHVREVRQGNRKLYATDNHPFFSYRYDADTAKKLGRYALSYVRADMLSEAIVPKTSIDYGSPYKLEMPAVGLTFETSNQHGAGYEATRTRESRLSPYAETTDDLMWLLGLYLGDGSTYSAPSASGGKRWSKVTFSVPRDDRARARLMTVMEEVLPGVAPTERADGVSVTWNSVELAEFFERNGFMSGAGIKRMPSWVLDLPESQRVQLIAGYLDSDGCATPSRRGFSIKSVNRGLVDDAADVLTTLGIASSTSSEEGGPREIGGKPSVSNGCHRLEFAADPRILAAVSEGLQSAVAKQTPAKLQHFRTVGRSQIELPETVEIRKVEVGEALPVVPTWDIEVEGTGNFVAEGFIVHNSKVTMKYPSIYLLGERARGEVLSIAYAGAGQHQDAGGKVIHGAPNTQSSITSKSISKDGGRGGYRGLVRIEEGATHAKSHVICDALILDADSRSDTYPYIEIEEESAAVSHEASVSKVSDEQLFYLMSRGLSETEAMQMIVRGFIEPIVKELPLEYAVELQRLVELQMEGSVG